MHILGLAQSIGLFLVVSLATATVLSVAMAALARLERAAVRVTPPRRIEPPRPAEASRWSAERVSSPGSCSFTPRTR